MSQQRKKLFIDASFLEDPAIDDWPIVYQMGYIRIWIESDNVGVWKPHFRKLEFNLKTKVDTEDFLESLNSGTRRVKVLPNGDWWLIDYLPLQVNTLTPTNRPHVSYIEDLHFHGLLTEYAIQNPDNVKFEVVNDLKNYEEIENVSERKKARSAYLYLDSKGLVRPLQEACETLARGWEGSKDKEEDKEQEEEQEQDEFLITNVDRFTNGEKKESAVEFLSEKPALFYHKLAQRLKEIIPEDVLDGISSEIIESDLETFHDTLKADGIQAPRDFIIDKAKSTDWTGMRWDDFDSMLFETETPF